VSTVRTRRNDVGEGPGEQREHPSSLASDGASPPEATVAPDRSDRAVVTRMVGWIVGVTTTACTIMIWWSYRSGGQNRFTLFDDAMISMSYGRTLAEGGGLVWYPGAPAVEGYTNPLWTLMMAAFHAVGLSGGSASLAVMVTSAALVVCSALLTMAITAEIAGEHGRAAFAAGIITGLFMPLLFWSLRGMEVGLFTALALAGTLLVLRSARRARTTSTVALCAVVALGLLTRTDFAVPTVVFLGWLSLTGGRSGRRRVALPVAAVGAAALVAQTAFRVTYYGDAFPNTYYLKLGLIPLTTRVSRGVLVIGFQLTMGVALLLVLGWFAYRSEVRRSALLLLVALAGGLAVYTVYVGGDAWEHFGFADRYLVPAIILLVPGACLGIQPLLDRLAARPASAISLRAVVVGALVATLLARALLITVIDGTELGTEHLTAFGVILCAIFVVAVGLLASTSVPGPGPSRPGWRAVAPFVTVVVALLVAMNAPVLAEWTRTGLSGAAEDSYTAHYGELLESITTDDATVALVWAGAPAYYSNRRSIDLLGKSDAVIAHEPPHTDLPLHPGHDKWDFDHSIRDLRPDLVAQMTPGAGVAYLPAMRDQGYVQVWPKGAAAQLVGPAAPLQILMARRDSPNVRWDLVEPVG
jgi:hypothetical protein